jgi:hypothetical protein
MFLTNRLGIEMKTSNLAPQTEHRSERVSSRWLKRLLQASLRGLILSRQRFRRQASREQASDSLPEREPVRRDIDRQFLVRVVVNFLNLPNLRDQQPDVHGVSPNVGLLRSRKVGSSGFERAFARRRGLIRFR